MTLSMKNRIERAEKASQTQRKFMPDCICFPENEQPQFHWPLEWEIAGRVRCPLHGERFRPVRFHVYVAEWLREKREELIETRHSAQYRKAWHAGFPPKLWPAEVIMINREFALRLKDGSVVTSSILMNCEVGSNA